jgi:hypothetical protein
MLQEEVCLPNPSRCPKNRSELAAEIKAPVLGLSTARPTKAFH